MQRYRLDFYKNIKKEIAHNVKQEIIKINIK